MSTSAIFQRIPAWCVEEFKASANISLESAFANQILTQPLALEFFLQIYETFLTIIFLSHSDLLKASNMCRNNMAGNLSIVQVIFVFEKLENEQFWNFAFDHGCVFEAAPSSNHLLIGS